MVMLTIRFKHPMARNGTEWGNTKTKLRRPLSTLALPSGVVDSLVADVREFLDLEDWYIQAGIPHHRGYLLHGPPGTGKSEFLQDVPSGDEHDPHKVYFQRLPFTLSQANWA
jgi:hypothetical protein